MAFENLDFFRESNNHFVPNLYCDLSLYEFEQHSQPIILKEKLRWRLFFWEFLKFSQFSIDTIRYCIPFIDISAKTILKNKSPLGKTVIS